MSEDFYPEVGDFVRVIATDASAEVIDINRTEKRVFLRHIETCEDNLSNQWYTYPEVEHACWI